MLKLNVGFNRKVGEANYCSRGAAVQLELEFESGLIGDPDQLQERIRQLFDLAKVAVDEELQRGTAPTSHGHACHGHGSHPSKARPASAAQVRALHAIAHRCGLELADTLRTRYGIHHAEDLSITEASDLIDELNSVTNGSGAP